MNSRRRPCLAFRLALLIVFLLPANFFIATASAVPDIQITSLPTYGQAGYVGGTVSGVDFSQYAVAIYLKVDGGGWWPKPNAVRRTVPIQSNGTFSADIGTAGLDPYASIYTAALVPKNAILPTNYPSETFPSGMSSVAVDSRQRYDRVIDFAGKKWGVKHAPLPVGPGGNYFANDAQNVWTDGNGLHLTIKNRDGQWRSSEVVLLEPDGYGTYSFQTNTRNDIMDANAVFGAYTWDEFGDEGRIAGAPYREIDFEDSRWGNAADPLNTQAVIQPWGVTGNRHRYSLPNLSTNADLTRFFTWEPDKIRFVGSQGHNTPGNVPPASVFDDWTYTHDPANNHLVPAEGREEFRFNLWLMQNTPATGQNVEVVVNDFSFTMAPGVLRCNNSGNWTSAIWDGTPPASPGSANGVVIDSPHVVSVSGPQQARWIAVGKGGQISLSAAGSLAVSSTVTIGEGGTLSVVPGASLSTAGLILTGGNFTNTASSLPRFSDGRLLGSGTINSPVTVSSGLIEVPGSSSLILNGLLSNYGLLRKTGPGSLELRGGNYQSNNNIAVIEGTLKYNFDEADSSNVLNDSVITVLEGATVELGGSRSGVGNAVAGAQILNNSAVGVLVSGTNQRLQNILGTGNTTVLAGADLTAGSISQNSLTIGGSLRAFNNGSSAQPVPEPASLSLLLATGILASLYRIWKGRGQKQFP
jgi:hypothetical protein